MNRKHHILLKFLVSAGIALSSTAIAISPAGKFSSSASVSADQGEIKDQVRQWVSTQPVQFLENKGQMKDENGNPVPFVLFRASAPGMDMYLTDKGLTYLFLKAEKKREKKGEEMGDETEKSTRIEWSRVDMELKGTSIKKENIVREIPSVTDYNYLFPHCPEGIYGVKQYEKITVKDIYPGIDWVLYNSTDKGFKYDFRVHPGADPAQIKLLYRTKENLVLDKEGNIRIQTPFGDLTENAPVSFLNGKSVETKFYRGLNEKNKQGGYDSEMQFQLPPSIFPLSTPLTIDPQLIWGTYYGGNGSTLDGLSGMNTDAAGNVYGTGYVESADIPTLNPGSGAYFQGVIASVFDGFLIKFSNAGVLLWATYCGGSGTDYGKYMVANSAGDVFLTGYTTSANFPTLNPGGGAYFQTTGGTFILKFNNAGLLLWGTHYGGYEGRSLALDASGNLLITGNTTSAGMTTLDPGGGAYFQAANAGGEDIYIAKFTNAGVLIWATYLGGPGNDYATSIAVDVNSNVFITGGTNTSIPTLNPGGGAYFQPVFAGNADAFLLKFGNNSALIWATYYGGSDHDEGIAITTDVNDNVFVAGWTFSNDIITLNPGGGAYFQGVNAGNGDIFILKFSNTGTLLWSTYYGGTGADAQLTYITYIGSREKEIVTDANGDLYVTGMTGSNDFPIFDPGCGSFFRGTLAGGAAYMLQFSNTGVRKWATFCGASSGFGAGLAMDPSGCVFAAGEWNSAGSSALANPGASAYYDAAFGGRHDSYVIKFCPIVTVLSTTVAATSILCKGQCNGTATTAPKGCAPYSYLWSSGQTTSVATGLCPGNYTVIVTDASGTTVTATVTITEPPAITLSVPTILNVNCNSLCTGSATAAANGGSPAYTYVWNTAPSQSTAAATGLCAGNYTVTVTDSSGCDTTQIVTITEPPVLTSTLTSTTPDTCSKGNGTAAVTANGGTPVYTYNWLPSGGVAANATGLTGGITYTALITDANGCTQIQTVTTTTVSGFTVTATPQTNVSCYGGGNGSATASSTGGTPPFTYSWITNPVQNTPTANGLSATTYSVIVTDANGCRDIQTVTLTEPPAIAIATMITPAGCDTSTGIAIATPVGGTGAYTFAWNNGQASAIATGLAPVNYTITVTDANGCTKDTVITMTELTCPCPDNLELRLTLPNAFSPNTDGENDWFCLPTGQTGLYAGIAYCIKKFDIIIYDRWGEKIFESGDPKFCWDGTYKGKMQNTAVYVYAMAITFIDNKEIAKEGNISLIR